MILHYTHHCFIFTCIIVIIYLSAFVDENLVESSLSLFEVYTVE